MNQQELLRRNDISAAAKLILLVLPSEQVRICDLPERTGLSRRTVYRALDRLEDAGLILHKEWGYVTRNTGAA